MSMHRCSLAADSCCGFVSSHLLFRSCCTRAHYAQCAAACVALLRRRKREQRLLRTSPTGVAAAETVVQAVEVEVQEAGVGTAVAQVWAASRVAVPAEVLVQPGRVQV